MVLKPIVLKVIGSAPVINKLLVLAKICLIFKPSNVFVLTATKFVSSTLIKNGPALPLGRDFVLSIVTSFPFNMAECFS